MIISHKIGEHNLKKEVSEDPLFLLPGKNGGFTYLSANNPVSRFEGVHFSKKDEIYKVIEDIRLVGREATKLTNRAFVIERSSQNAVECFFTNQDRTLLYEIKNFKGYAKIVLDCRKIYDFDTNGRKYKIYQENGVIVVEYTKFKNKANKESEYKFYLVIAGIDNYAKPDKWVLKQYPFDKKRNSYPSELYVYDALRYLVDCDMQIVFTFSLDKNEAITKAIHAKENFMFIKKSKEALVNILTKENIKSKNNEIQVAYKCSLNALEGFHGDMGLYAGFPWFTQIWTRDEAISLGALLKEKQYSLVKELLFKHLQVILPDGRLPNRLPSSMLGSADGVGWVYKRFYDFLTALQSEGRLAEFISSHELLYIKKRLAVSIQGLLKEHTKNGLAVSGELETWMDTYYQDDKRAGARIEIQALRLIMYRLMIFLCEFTGNDLKYDSYKELEHVSKHMVREVFWKKRILSDGAGDNTIRPNIFLAYYIYPRLLTKREWTRCFDRALESLWLPWGGVATIDKNHKYFSPFYTGQDNKSYHRGDSWFYINNLVALCLYRLNKSKYDDYIKKIIEASTHEILYKGIIGYHAELSSANNLSAEASLAQCWSSALYIEMIKEIYG